MNAKIITEPLKANDAYINISALNGIEVSERLDITAGLRLLGTAILAIMQGAVDNAAKTFVDDDEKISLIKGGIYDMTNSMFGNILDMFDPENSPQTNLTAQAIMEAENAILDREVPDEALETMDEEDFIDATEELVSESKHTIVITEPIANTVEDEDNEVTEASHEVE